MEEKHEDAKRELSAVATFCIIAIPGSLATIFITILFDNAWSLFLTLPIIIFVAARASSVFSFVLPDRKQASSNMECQKHIYIPAFEAFIEKELGGAIPEEMYTKVHYIRFLKEDKRYDGLVYDEIKVPMPGKGVRTSMTLKDDAYEILFAKLNPWLAVNHPDLCQREMASLMVRGAINVLDYTAHENN